MNLLRRQETWDPFRELQTLESKLSQLFDWSRVRGDGGREALVVADYLPACDIVETDKDYRIRVELPDVKKDDVHVTFADNVLTIQGDRREEKEEKGVRFYRREISAGHFMRRFTMPDDADDSKVDAAYKDGILTISINRKLGREAKAREIAVH